MCSAHQENLEERMETANGIVVVGSMCHNHFYRLYECFAALCSFSSPWICRYRLVEVNLIDLHQLLWFFIGCGEPVVVYLVERSSCSCLSCFSSLIFI